MNCPKCGSNDTERTDYDHIPDGQGYESRTIETWYCHDCEAEWDEVIETKREIKMRTKTVRVIIPVKFDVSYILEVESTEKEDIIDKILSGDFDPANWEHDPCFYEGLWDAIKFALEKGDIEIEDIEEEE